MSIRSLIKDCYKEFDERDSQELTSNGAEMSRKLMRKFVKGNRKINRKKLDLLGRVFLANLPMAYLISVEYRSDRLSTRDLFVCVAQALYEFLLIKYDPEKGKIYSSFKSYVRAPIRNALKSSGIVRVPRQIYEISGLSSVGYVFLDVADKLSHEYKEKCLEPKQFEIVLLAKEFREQAVSLFKKIRLMSLVCKVNAKRNWDIFRKVTGIPVPGSSADFFGSEPKKQCSVMKEFGMSHQAISKIVNQILKMAKELDPRIGNTVREFILYIDSYYAALEIIAANENKSCS